MCFRYYGLQNTCLGKCLKSPLSEDPLTTKVVNRTKHCFNLEKRTFTRSIDHCEGNGVEKSLSY